MMASTGTSRIPLPPDDEKGCPETNRILDELLPDPIDRMSRRRVQVSIDKPSESV